MSKSTAAVVAKKPRPDFPLFPHRTGRWAKKVRGKFCYFGKVGDDPNGEKALAQWLDERDDLLAGRVPRKRRDGLVVADLVNAFLTDRERRLEANEITPRTFAEYHKTAGRVVDAFGRNRSVDDLATDDFAALRSNLAKTRGPVALGNEIQRIRTVFKFGFDNGLMDRPIRYGTAFEKPPAKAIRKARAAAGPRMFQAVELRKIIKAAPQPLLAMILLGLNGAMGAADIASLPQSAVDLKAGWMDFAREKTGVPRRCPLWAETVKAIRGAIKDRPVAKDPADADLCFINSRGKRWLQHSASDDVAKWAARQDLISRAFGQLLGKLGVNGHRGFYCLRRTFQTVAEESGDFPAVSHVMGHAPRLNDMSATYRQTINDERLRTVTNTVRAWLWPDAK